MRRVRAVYAALPLADSLLKLSLDFPPLCRSANRAEHFLNKPVQNAPVLFRLRPSVWKARNESQLREMM
jgi:hypothetical protein